MAIHRRNFILLCAGIIGVFLTGWFSLNRFFSKFQGAGRSTFKRLAEPKMPDTPPGPLNEETLATLVSTVEALAGLSLLPDHYRRYYSWRAENLTGYRTVYESFVKSADLLSIRNTGVPFRKGSLGQRQELLKTFRVHTGRKRIDRVRTVAFWKLGLIEKDSYLFEERIFKESLDLFADTDAWVHLGYWKWPGRPRGLIRYTQPPV